MYSLLSFINYVLKNHTSFTSNRFLHLNVCLFTEKDEAYILLTTTQGEDDVNDDVNLKPDDIITQLGGCGLFQILLSVIAQSMKIAVCWVMSGNSFFFYVPRWRCVSFDHSVTNTSSTVAELNQFGDYTHGDLFNVTNTTSEQSEDYWDKRCSLEEAKCILFEYEEGMYTLVTEVNRLVHIYFLYPHTMLNVSMSYLKYVQQVFSLSV